MPILDIQTRFRELGRIRTGIKVPNARGNGSHPEKLPRFRLTSPWEHLIEQAASVFGGEPRPWDNAGQAEHEVIVEVESLPVVIPPGEILDQWYELWSGGGCQRRCDGVSQVLVARPCACPADPIERQELAGQGKACKPTTRVRFMLPDVADVGIWRLESHGFHAAAELGGSAGLVAAATRQGAMIPADLRLSPREGARRPGVAKKTFYVPAISFRGTLGPVLDALGILDDGATMPRLLGVEGRPEISAGGTPALHAGGKAFDPAPTEAAQFPPPPIAPPAPPPSSSSDPGPGIVETPVGFAPPPATAPAPPTIPPPAPEAYEPPPAPVDETDTREGPSFTGPQLVAIRFGERGIHDRAHRLAIAGTIAGRPITSGKDLTNDETRFVLGMLADDEAFAEYLEACPPPAPDPGPTSPETPPEAPAVPDAPPVAPEPGEPIRGELVDPGGSPPRRRRPAEPPEPVNMNGDQWRKFLAARSVKVSEVIREANRLASEAGTVAPANLEEIAGSELAPALIVFVEALALDRGQG